MKNQKTLSFKIKTYNNLMVSGNKNMCEKLILKTVKLIQKSSNKDFLDLFKLAIINSSPALQIKKIKRKRKKLKEFSYIPNEKTRIFLSLKLILGLLKKDSKNFHNKLKQEILQSSKNNSNINKIKENNQEQSLKLKKYSHFRWLI